MVGSFGRGSGPGGCMLFVKVIQKLNHGEELSLVSRLNAKEWRRVGTLRRFGDSVRVSFDAAAAVVRPCWRAAEDQKRGPAQGAATIEFAVRVPGRGLLVVALAEVTGGLLGATRGLGAAEEREAADHHRAYWRRAVGGPRKPHSVWPEWDRKKE